MKLSLIFRIIALLLGIALVTFTAISLFIGTNISFTLPSVPNIYLAIGLIIGIIIILFALVRIVKKEFVMQKSEYGDLKISTKAIKGLIQKVISNYHEINLKDVDISYSSNNIIANIKANLSTGANIPLLINDLQKQIIFQVERCTGLKVKEINFEIENSSKVDEKLLTLIPVEIENNIALENKEEIIDQDTAELPKSENINIKDENIEFEETENEQLDNTKNTIEVKDEI